MGMVQYAYRHAMPIYTRMRHVCKDDLHPVLLAALKRGFVTQVRYDGKSYRFGSKRYRGLHSALESAFYPLNWRIKQRHYKTKKRGSSRKQGKAVERAIDRHVFEGKPLRQRMAKAVVAKWKEMGHRVVAAQWPVLLYRKGICTQADYITEDRATGGLWMWELKTGWPVIPRSPKAFRNLPSGVAAGCTPFARWDMQRAMTHRALVRDAEIPLVASRIIHVWEEQTKTPFDPKPHWVARCKVLQPLEWVERHADAIYKGL